MYYAIGSGRKILIDNKRAAQCGQQLIIVITMTLIKTTCAFAITVERAVCDPTLLVIHKRASFVVRYFRCYFVVVAYRLAVSSKTLLAHMATGGTTNLYNGKTLTR